MSSPCLIPCREIVELVTDYLEGALIEADRARFESHVGACGHCATYMEQMRITVKVVGHVDPGGLDPRVEAVLLDAFRGWKHGSGDA